MLELPAVSLFCIDCNETALSLAAVEQSLVRFKFAETVFVTDRSVEIETMRVVHIPDLREPGAMSRFITRSLAGSVGNVGSTHALLIGWDAFVTNPDAWTDQFLDFDIVTPRRKVEGAPAITPALALLSRRLLEHWRDGSFPADADVLTALRAGSSDVVFLLRDAKRAPVELSERFAHGDYAPVGTPLGFERLCNMWMLFQPRDLDAFIAMASPDVLQARDALSLAVNLHALGRINEAITLLKAIVATNPPANADARNLLDAIFGRQATVVATIGSPSGAGRNDPCPCGSGKRYKQCHGAIGGQGVATPLPNAAMSAAPPVAESSLNIPKADGAAAVWMHRAREAFRRNDVTAESLHRRVLADEPNNAEAISYLGVMAMREGKPQDAEALLLRAIDLAPHMADYRNNLGMYRQMLEDEPGAASAYADAIRLDPLYAPAHNNLGLVLQDAGRVDAAITAFRKAIDAAPAFADTHWNLGIALLANGDFEEGLEEHEWRFKAAQNRKSWERRQRLPTWRGETLHGKTILLLAEQGLGDIIQYVRYAVALSERGASVVVESPRELMALMRTTRGVTMVAPRDGPFPPCDVQIPVMSLPYLFRTRVDSIPSPVPYIAADPQRTARWQALIGEKTKPRIGISWSGNPAQVRNKRRSLPLSAFEPLLARTDIEWFSLQKGLAADQIASLPQHLSVRDLMPRADDFADTAVLVNELDLVITTDTAVAHVAGALGAPTLTLLDAAPDCRWLRDRSDSPWYPTMRLLRQQARGDWGDVVAEAVREVDQRFGITK